MVKPTDKSKMKNESMQSFSRNVINSNYDHIANTLIDSSKNRGITTNMSLCNVDAFEAIDADINSTNTKIRLPSTSMVQESLRECQKSISTQNAASSQPSANSLTKRNNTQSTNIKSDIFQVPNPNGMRRNDNEIEIVPVMSQCKTIR